MGTLAFRLERQSPEANNPNCVKVGFDETGMATFFSRKAPPAPPFYKHIGIYAYRRGFLRQFVSWPKGRLEAAERLEQLRALERGSPIKVIETSLEAIDVNLPQDLERLRQALACTRDVK